MCIVSKLLSPGENLRHSVHNWEKIGSSKTVIDWITNGIKIPFANTPGKIHLNNHVLNNKQLAFVNEEIKQFSV